MVTSLRKSPWHLGRPPENENENRLGGGAPAGEDLARKTRNYEEAMRQTQARLARACERS